tara:strand:- start:345 stop:524 length:180 start_codon:yes stop_codon:yes gene_type:complete
MKETFKVNGLKFVRDGNSFIEEEKLKAYQERLKTAFKVGGKLSGLQNYNKVIAKRGQKD